MSNVNINEALRKAAESVKNGVDKKTLSTLFKELSEQFDEKKPAYSYRKEIAESKAAQLERTGKALRAQKSGKLYDLLKADKWSLGMENKDLAQSSWGKDGHKLVIDGNKFTVTKLKGNELILDRKDVSLLGGYLSQFKSAKR